MILFEIKRPNWTCAYTCSTNALQTVTGDFFNSTSMHHLWQIGFYAGQFSSLTLSCLTLCDPMDWSTPGFPVHHQLLEPTQTHIHRIGDAIQLSHPLVWVNLSGGRSGLHWIFLVCCLRFSYLSSLLWQTVWCSFQPVLLRCNLIVLC